VPVAHPRGPNPHPSGPQQLGNRSTGKQPTGPKWELTVRIGNDTSLVANKTKPLSRRLT